jgi:hypothetical protein
LLIPTPKLRHILPALVFASQSPYPGWQNVVNSRNVMRNTAPNWLENIIKNLRKRLDIKENMGFNIIKKRLMIKEDDAIYRFL